MYKSRTIKCPDGKYKVDYSYKTPDGVLHRTCKRGFKLKREAEAWQVKELPSIVEKLESGKRSSTSKSGELLFENLVESYMARSSIRRKSSTCDTKDSIIKTKILPFFSGKSVFDITVADIEEWQDMLLTLKTKTGDALSPTYIRTIRSQMTAIMNYAVKIHGLPLNPLDRAEMIGKKTGEEKPIWNINEYKLFRSAISDKPMYFYAFEVLFWTGMRMGEMMALKISDIDFENLTITVDETYYAKGDLLTDTKTECSKRMIHIPALLGEELREYTLGIYGLKKNMRLFPVSKTALHRELDRGISIAGITDISVHRIRHSHISLLASSLVGAREVAIARRVGHAKQTMTERYTHAYTEDLISIATRLNELMEEMENV